MIPDGVYAASLTPLDSSLAIDHGAYARHARWLLRNGCDGLALMGTTGEATSFSVGERQEALEQLLASGVPSDRIMVGTGCAATTDTIALTRHALQCGVDHVLMLPPFYFKEPSDDGLFAAFSQVVQAVGDARLRVFLYHFPRMSAVPISHALIERLIEAYPTAIAGVKDSSGDLGHMKSVMQSFPELRFFAGTEEYLVDVLRAGGTGCISATVNITCRLTGNLYAHWQKGENGRLLERIVAIRKEVESGPVIPGLKRIMAELTQEPAWRFVRPPHVPLGEAGAHNLAGVVREVDQTLEL